MSGATFPAVFRAIRTSRPPDPRQTDEARYLSLYVVAKRTGLSYSAVCRAEKDGHSSDRETVERIATALDCTEAERVALLASAGYAPACCPHCGGRLDGARE